MPEALCLEAYSMHDVLPLDDDDDDNDNNNNNDDDSGRNRGNRGN